MRTFFEQRFESHLGDQRSANSSIAKVVVIGSDCPQLGQNLMRAAFDELEQNEMVIGPSTDGGYYLIGMRKHCFNVFANIPWSTSSVLADTIRQIEAQGISYGLLPPLTDVDDDASLQTLVKDLAGRKSLGDLDALDRRLYQQVCQLLDRTAREPQA